MILKVSLSRIVLTYMHVTCIIRVFVSMVLYGTQKCRHLLLNEIKHSNVFVDKQLY